MNDLEKMKAGLWSHAVRRTASYSGKTQGRGSSASPLYLSGPHAAFGPYSGYFATVIARTSELSRHTG